MPARGAPGARRALADSWRFSFQHRAFYCYLIMSLWIFFLVTAMYKYIAPADDVVNVKKAAIQYSFKNDAKLKRIFTNYCNPPEGITLGAEGTPDAESWYLQGVLGVTRHGDRGPLTHIRGGDSLPCNTVKQHPLLKSYEEYVWNATASGRAVWVQAPGPFHNFPTLPVVTEATSCALGQLTLQGVHQMLRTGEILKQAYSKRLGWTDTTDADASKQAPGDVVAYSTRSRRTFQSAIALLFALVPPGAFPARAAALRESHSITFCFRECACPRAEHFVKRLSSEAKGRLQSHPGIIELVKKTSKVVFESQEHTDPDVLRDALLAPVCHNVPLPCADNTPDVTKDNKKTSRGKFSHHFQKTFRNSAHHVMSRSLLDTDIDALNLDLDYINNQLDFNNEIGRKARDIIEKNYESKTKVPLDFDAQMEREKLVYYQQKYMENADPNYDDVLVVKKHLDSDFNFNIETKLDTEFDETYSEVTPQDNPEQVCVKKDQLTSLFAFTEWNYKQHIKSPNNKKKSILNAYGCIHNIVKNMIRMISENKPKFVYYSGHDKTIQALISALGLGEFHYYNVFYASRMIFEVYRKRDLHDEIKSKRRKAVAQDFYFRVVFNGVDVTNQLSFCRGWHNIVVGGKGKGESDKGAKSYLCPIENIVRFIHDDYFAIFNASNFKDACSTR